MPTAHLLLSTKCGQPAKKGPDEHLSGTHNSPQKIEGTSMSVKTKRNTLLTASATAIGAIGLLTVPTPAPAHAACDQYAFNGEFKLRQSVGNTTVTLPASNTRQVSGTAHGGGNDGQVQGGMTANPRELAFHISWTGGAYGVYTGNIHDDGTVHGTTFDANSPSNKGTWDSLTSLVCAPPPAPAPAPAPAPNGPPRQIGRASVRVFVDVDVYNVKNEPDGAGKKIGMRVTSLNTEVTACRVPGAMSSAPVCPLATVGFGEP
jgi:hypothetical protein